MTERGSFDLGSACQGVGDLNDGTMILILDLFILCLVVGGPEVHSDGIFNFLTFRGCL
jgi:hypothetical protein